jgi:AraC-like DNA-binding protein
MKKTYCSENSASELFTLFDSTKYRKQDAYRNHTHTQIELGFVVKGAGEYVLEGNRFDVRSGDLFLVRPNEQHCVPTVTSDELVSFNIHFSPLYVWRVLSDFIKAERLNSLVRSDITISARIRDNAEITALLQEMRVAFSEDDRFALRRLVPSLLVEVAKLLPESEGAAGSTLHLGDVRAAVRYIEEKLSEHITLEDIARAGSMSKSHLNEWFRMVTGMTPYEYLLVSRVERAVELLRTTDMTVLAVSEVCGFSNLANFNKAFKKRTGLTPQGYRKSH